MSLFVNYLNTFLEKNENDKKIKTAFNKNSKVVTFLTLKGGVGKTTLAYCLAKELTAESNSVLVIDMDPQANLSLLLDPKNKIYNSSVSSIYNILFEDFLLGNAIQTTNSKNLSIIFSNDELSLLNQKSQKKHLNLFSQMMRLLKTKYDYIIIDCPPTSSVIHAMSIMNSDIVLSPILFDAFSLQGAIKTISDVSDISQKYKVELKHKIIFNRINSLDPLIVERASKIREIIPPNYWLTSLSDKGSEFDFSNQQFDEFQSITEFVQSNRHQNNIEMKLGQ